jgi:ribosomal protein L11 methyltransferase
MPSETDWPGLELRGEIGTLDEIEPLIGAILDESVFLGTARQTWYDPKEAANAPDGSPVGGRGSLIVYLAQGADIAIASQVLEHGLGEGSSEAFRTGALTLNPLVTPDADWATLWRDFFRPIRVSESLVVLPAWYEVEEALDSLGLGERQPTVIRIEPGRAFGSGTHATTLLCLRGLDGIVGPKTRVLDFGAGSGILSFTAAALGAQSIVAVEIDPETTKNFEENRRLNRAAIGDARIDHRIGSSEILGKEERFDLIVCNALFQRVADHLPALAERLADGGHLLYSGFLTEQHEEVTRFVEHEMGLRILDITTEGEWEALSARACV